jgi:hypothetical protein
MRPMPPQGASFAGVRVRALEPAGNDGPRGMILERMPTGIREQNPAYSPPLTPRFARFVWRGAGFGAPQQPDGPDLSALGGEVD